MIQRILRFIKELRQQYADAPDSHYRSGGIHALDPVIDYIESEMWDAGIDEEEGEQDEDV